MPDLANEKITVNSDEIVSKTLEAAGLGPRRPDPVPDLIMTTDQINYMGDLLAELEEMARRGKMDTLATMLGLAVGEARQQMAKMRRY